MNKILYLLVGILLSLYSCDNCSKIECFNFWNGERIIFLDSNNQNLLDPTLQIGVEYFETASGIPLEFAIKNYSIDKNSPEDIWHLETISNEISEQCLERSCDLLLKFTHRPYPDTISFVISRVDSDCCVNHETENFSFNNRAIDEKHQTIGAYIIRVPE